VQERFPEGYAPTSIDAPHQLVFFASQPLPWKLLLNAAFQARSGVASTPVSVRIPVFSPSYDHTAFRYLQGARNSVRLSPISRLDLGVRRQFRWQGADGAIVAQVLNVLNRPNLRSVNWPQYYELLSSSGNSSISPLDAAGVRGLPVLPTIGVELRW
jgi:hypothetical protein